MLDIERYMETFQESISKRLEKQENNFKNLTDKMKSFEVTQREYKKRLSSLEDQRNADENEDIELQKVKNFNYLLFFSFFYLYLSSTNNNNNNGESKDVTTKQPINLGNRQEQQVYTFLVEFLRVYQIF